MEKIFTVIMVSFFLTISLACKQNTMPPTSKKENQLENYKLTSLKEISVSKSPSQAAQFKTRVIYTGVTKPISEVQKNTLSNWAQHYAGNPEQYTADYLTEINFVQKGVEYPLAIKNNLLLKMQNQLKAGDEISLLLMKVEEDSGNSVLLIEEFLAP